MMRQRHIIEYDQHGKIIPLRTTTDGKPISIVQNYVDPVPHPNTGSGYRGPVAHHGCITRIVRIVESDTRSSAHVQRTVLDVSYTDKRTAERKCRALNNSARFESTSPFVRIRYVVE